MEQRYREIIGRAAMLIVAIGLLWGAVPVLRAGWRVTLDEQANAKRRSESFTTYRERTTSYGLLFLAGGVLLGLGGLYFLKLALFSHRHLDENPPKAPVLWDNPEPGPRHWRGP